MLKNNGKVKLGSSLPLLFSFEICPAGIIIHLQESDMADFTARAIRETFLQILNEKPLASITVKEIVTRCGINRNTFYYHFHDIPSLLEDIVERDAGKIMADGRKRNSLEDCLEDAINFALEHRNAVKNIYSSVSRSIFEQSLWRVCDHVVSSYVDIADGSRRLPDEKRNMIIQYLKAVLFGLSSLWLESGLDENILTQLHSIAALKEGDLEELVEKASRS